MNAPAELHTAFLTLSLAEREYRGVAVPASSGPAPLGMHIELAAPEIFNAFKEYGPYSINVDVWRESDRLLLADPNRPPRPDPLIDQLDSMNALLLSLDKTELDVAQTWAAKFGVRIERRPR